ncbi:hypothetical protein [Absidia glauca]|uniref:Ndc10 domain-containing protein n=1 Tax=Absidia glauca TaxID=4829 RepID=A0A168QC49_ABSGL|nr:hypothetical protein [Absidia glauca]
MLNFADNKDLYGGGLSEYLTRVPGKAGTQFEIKIKPPRQAQEWSYSSHQESIGKVLSSPGIRYNKKAHINCGSSARMAGNMCANVDQIRRQGRWNNITINGAYLTNLPRELVRSMADFPTYDRFFYHARAALKSPARSYSRRSANDMTDWRRKSSSWRSYSTYRRLKCICTGDHDVQEDFYTRLGAHDGTAPLLSHLATLNLL